MDQTAKLAVFQAQCSNVRSLKTAMRQIHRNINAALRSNNEPSAEAFTKVYAMLFCAWSEANFSKVIHTPYGFELNEIEQIQLAKANGISKAWKKCVELGLRHLDVNRGSFKPNARKKLEAAIDAHIFDPSILRNKLAHGQWVVALNRENDGVNAEITSRINEITIVTIGAWIEAQERLAGLVESLIESPKKAFIRDWYGCVSDLEAAIIAAESKDIKEHITRLREKDVRTGTHEKRRGRL